MLKDKSGDLAAYRSWKDPGSKFDMPPVITATWFFFAGGLSVAGTVGVFLLIGAPLEIWMGIVAWSIFVVAVLALA
jgi:hypothetical protein